MRGSSKKTSSVSDSKDEAYGTMAVVPETNLKSIHKEAQDVACSESEDPGDLFLQLQRLIATSGESYTEESLHEALM